MRSINIHRTPIVRIDNLGILLEMLDVEERSDNVPIKKRNIIRVDQLASIYMSGWSARVSLIIIGLIFFVLF